MRRECSYCKNKTLRLLYFLAVAVMDKLIQIEKTRSFTDEDVKRLCDNKVKIVTYTELYNYGTIEELLSPYGCVILLYLTRENYGHWVFVQRLRGQSDTLEHFDSYGYAIDDELFMVPDSQRSEQEFKDRSGQSRPYLTELIQKSPSIKHVIYNRQKLQSSERTSAGSVNTCGRWCGMRCVLRDTPLEVFQKLFIGQQLEPDDYVTLISMFIA